MSQDIVADALNQIMNAKRVGKMDVVVGKSSNLLINLFEMMKEKGYIDFKIEEDGKMVVKIIKLNECRAIKPRYFVKAGGIEKYLRRFLISRKFGTLVISTNKGLMDQDEAEANKIGGTLIAFFY